VNAAGKDYLYSIMQIAMRAPALYVDDDKSEIRDALSLKEITTPDASMAVAWAGTVPYFADRSAIDLLGKSDSIIAHQPMRRPPDAKFFFRPGHMKWNYAYSIGALKPDIVEDPWPAHIEAEPFLSRDYTKLELGHTYWLRKDSRNIRWDAIGASGSTHFDLRAQN
jgi:hypothetical protein